MLLTDEHFHVNGSSGPIIDFAYDDELYQAILTVTDLTDVVWHVVRIDGAIEDLAGTSSLAIRLAAFRQ